ncbi:1640_t:CDS:2 [Entrophospora sp. SA101]|nr:1640_t:CDS:2 [Entrophospora sp. SA101]
MSKHSLLGAIQIFEPGFILSNKPNHCLQISSLAHLPIMELKALTVLNYISNNLRM